MSQAVQWIRAEAEDLAKPMPGDGLSLEQKAKAEGTGKGESWQSLPPHNFGARGVQGAGSDPECAVDRNPEIWIYRSRTTGLLRRYMRLSLEAGRLPSVVGREVFRAKITNYTSVTFEDRVIFVHDVEACLERLGEFDRGIIARVVLQEQDHERAARLLGCTRKTIERRFTDLIDELSEDFLRVGLLVALDKQGRPLAKPFVP